jgi:hypothetical protein
MPNETQLSEARADWIDRGLDAAAFDRAMSGQLPPPAAPTPPPADPSPRAPVAVWSDKHAADTVAVMRQQGVSDDTLRQHLRADGYNEAQVAALLSPAAPDKRSDDEKALEHGGLEPGKAADFRAIEYAGRAPEGVDLFAFDSDAKAFMEAVAAPALLGPSLVEAVLDAGRAYAVIPEAHRPLFHATEEQRVGEILGPDRAREAYSQAAEMLKSDKIPLPFLEWLHGSGALRRADVIVQLANIASIAGVRAGVKGGASIDELLSPH